MSDYLWPHEFQHARFPCPTYVHWDSDAMQPSCPLLPPLLLLPSTFPCIRVFSNWSALCIRCPKYWSFSFSITFSNKYSGLISFRIDRFDLLTVQGTLQESSPAPQFKSILQCSAFFMVVNSHIHTELLEKP